MNLRVTFAALAAAFCVGSAAAERFEIWQDHADALYRVGEEAVMRVTVLNDDGAIRREGRATWKLDNFGSQLIAGGEQDLAKANPFFVRGKLDHPDFLRLTVKSGKDSRVWSVGYDVEKIRQAKARPADFDSYWAGEKARLAAIPLDPKCEKLDWLSNNRWDAFRISFATLNDRRVYGFMTVPKNEALKPMRCRVRICDAGGGAVGPWESNDGEVTVTMNVHYFEPPRDAKEMRRLIDETSAALAEKYHLKKGTYYASAGIGVSREDYYFHDSMLGIARAFDWLAERPFVDPNRLVYYGSSQGGGFGLATVYLNPRFSRACFCVPAITGHYGTPHFSSCGWPSILANQNAEGRLVAEKFAAYFDGVNFAAGIKTPVRFIVGFADTTCPPPDVYSAYNACPAEDKAIINAIGGGHGTALKWSKERMKDNPALDVDGWLRAPDSKRTRVQLWFDTEDYTNPSAWDAIRELAKIMTAEGVRGHFNTAGYLAKRLVDERRFDVIDAMKKHVIGTQSLYHSWHPNVTEKGDLEDYEEAYRLIMKDEAEGYGMLRAAFGVNRLVLSCNPGNGSSYVGFDVYSDLGAVFHGGGPTFGREECPLGDGIWYQNQLHILYNGGMSLQALGLDYDISEKDLAAVLDHAAKKQAVTFYMHPCITTCRQFWDGQNMKGGNWAEFGHWVPADQRDAESIARFYERFREFIRRVKADPRFEFTDCDRLQASMKARRAITVADLPAIRASLTKELGPVSAPGSWSVADCFQAAVKLLNGETVHNPGKVYGFLEKPVGVEKPTRVKAADLRAAAKKIVFRRHLPVRYQVGENVLGPADFLFAALEVLTTGADEVVVEPRDQLGALRKHMPRLVDFIHTDTWIYHPSFKDRYLADRLRWQFWTMRYE